VTTNEEGDLVKERMTDKFSDQMGNLLNVALPTSNICNAPDINNV